MSLINQMLRDLENRNTINNTPPTLQHNIQVTHAPSSKRPFLIWTLLAIIATGGTYWAYLYSNTLTKTPPVIIAENNQKDPTPIAPYEQVLATPNAVSDTVPQIEPKLPENNAATQPVPTIQPTPALQPPPPAQPTPAAPSQAAPETIAAQPIKNTPIPPKPALIKQITDKQQADLLYRQAENSFDDYSTINKLEEILKLDPRHLKARLLLAKKLHSQGQINKTADFLDQSLILFPDNLQFINTRAQLFLQQKNPGSALKTLQRIDLTSDSNDETYLSLLAASYQQLQSFNNAAKTYQRLITINPEKAENWLGLALSQEKLGNSRIAREAYQQALSKNTLKESIANYIKQRLIELR
ncbi:MAG: tetratricopeptide repeat protein [Methylobacter tundripaludum]|nr:tetratricopeptide repeat protein [Methylobacter tundripaludum]